MPRLSSYPREIPVALAFAALLLIVAVVSPAFFSLTNIRDLVLGNAPVLLVAIGMTLVILCGQIDISVGAQFAICSITAGLLARMGVPVFLLLPLTALAGLTLGAVNGLLIARLRIPSIVATLAAMVVWRDALRWFTEGAWVQNLPANFQWFGLGQTGGQWLIVIITALVFTGCLWALRHLAAGRAVIATGGDAEAARLAGLDPRAITFGVFALTGLLTGLAAVLNAIRFIEIPANAGVGLEMKAIAAVIVGGTAITGGRGSLIGTIIGVALLGAIGT
ncbi:MAG: ABC transporter permease, partial [Blastocatellia bacterium]